MDFIKKNVKIALIFLLMGIIGGAKLPNQKMTKSIDYEAFANAVTYSFIQEVKKELGLCCTLSGGSMPYDIESINVGFTAYRKASIDEARELEIQLIDKFLNIINNHEKIRPFLREYPFTGARAHISISFCNKRHLPETENSISHVDQVKNKIFYDIYDPKKESSSTVAEENYDDAYKIVHKNL